MSAAPGGSFATLTHARLRAAQGDVGGAVRILRVILSVQPEHEEARALLAAIENRVSVRHREPEPVPPDPVSEATAEGLSGRFRDALNAKGEDRRIVLLKSWLARAERNRGERRVR